jgi:hypothetical protein
MNCGSGIQIWIGNLLVRRRITLCNSFQLLLKEILIWYLSQISTARNSLELRPRKLEASPPSRARDSLKRSCVSDCLPPFPHHHPTKYNPSNPLPPLSAKLQAGFSWNQAPLARPRKRQNRDCSWRLIKPQITVNAWPDTGTVQDFSRLGRKDLS